MKHKKKVCSCKNLSLILDYAADRLPPEQKKQAKMHLESCTECSREYHLVKFSENLANLAEDGAVIPERAVKSSVIGIDKIRLPVTTLADVVHAVKQINKTSPLNSKERRQRVIVLVNRFMDEMNRFLPGRKNLGPGNDWLKHERKRALLLKKLLSNPVMAQYSKVMLQQADALINQGLILQLQDHYKQSSRLLRQALAMSWAMEEETYGLITKRVIGELEFYQDNYSSAERIFHEALKEARELEMQEEIAVLLRNLGNIAFIRQKFDLSQQFLEHALQISESLPDQRSVARDLNNLATVQYKLGNLQTACRFGEQALLRLSDSEHNYLQGQIHSNLGTYYSTINYLDEAREHWKHSHSIYCSIGSPEDQAHICRNMALVSYRLRLLDEALEILAGAFTADLEPIPLAQVHLLMGRILRHTGKPAEAKEEHNRAFRAAQESGDSLILRTAHFELAFDAYAMGDIYEAEIQIEKASINRKRWPRKPASIFSVEDEYWLMRIKQDIGDNEGAKKHRRLMRETFRRIQNFYEKNDVPKDSSELEYLKGLLGF